MVTVGYVTRKVKKTERRSRQETTQRCSWTCGSRSHRSRDFRKTKSVRVPLRRKTEWFRGKGYRLFQGRGVQCHCMSKHRLRKRSYNRLKEFPTVTQNILFRGFYTKTVRYNSIRD